MKKIAPLAILALFAAPVAAQDTNADIRAVADAFDAAQFHRDKAALEAMIAPDYLAVFGSGRVVGRAEFIDGFTAPGITFAPFEISDRLFVRIAPDAAVVGGEGRIKGVENGKPFAEHFRFSDIFARRDGKWVVVFTQVTPLPK
jgi:ketosteroid isomerase-like protein